MSRTHSERIVVASPLTYSGSYRRIAHRVRGVDSVWLRWLAAVPLAVVAVAVMWIVATLVWVLTLSLLFVSLPWKMIRRGSRKRKLEDARHRELLSSRQNSEQ